MTHLLYFIAATAGAAIMTPLVRLAVCRAGFVVAPSTERWHTRPTPTLGGIAIAGVFCCMFFVVPGVGAGHVPLLAGGLLIFLLGLVDDIRGLSPQVKFVGQIAVAAFVISMGTVVKIIPYPVIAYPLTFFWIVGLTNAFNLIDNMDGLSAGIGLISSLALFVFSLQYHNEAEAFLSIVLAGVCLGFLFYNFNPARIFMGDCGSMFLGFMLAVLSVSGTWKHASSLVVTLLVPVLMLSIPIIDTAFVTVMRQLKGRPISQGGKDHMSHRLVALGFSEKKTVLFLYMLAVLLCLGALFYTRISAVAFAGMVFILMVGLFYFCIYLGYAERFSVAQVDRVSDKTARFLASLRRFVEIFIDLVFVVAAYYAAHVIRFEGSLGAGEMQKFIQTLPLVVVVKISALYYFGLYQTVWRHVGVRDFMNIVKAFCLSSLLIVAMILMYSRFQYFSRTVFVIDALLGMLFVSGSHFSLRVLKEYLEGRPTQDRKVLLIGAGDAGEMALREIRNNPAMKFNVVGFLDDDPFKQHRRIHGVQVLGKIDQIETLSHKTGAREALIVIPSLSSDNLQRIVTLCGRYDVACRQFTYGGR